MSPRSSVVRSQEIEYSFWLIFDDNGGMRFTRTEPGLDRNERAMSMTAKLPRSLFKTPTLSGSINVPDQTGGPISIDVGAASEALRSALGVDIDLKVNAP